MSVGRWALAPTVAVPKYGRLGSGFTRREVAQSHIHAGRRVDGTQTPASWLLDLADTRKMILLCAFCQSKFNPARHGYRRWYAPSHTPNTDPHQVNGKCDACKAMVTSGGRGYISEETYSRLCREPGEARRASRAAWRRSTFWESVRQTAVRAWGQRAAL